MPNGFKMVSIYSSSDPLCNGKNARPAGGSSWQDFSTIELKHLSHSEFLLSKKSYDILYELIQSTGKERSPVTEVVRRNVG